jgi:DNA helicase-2/ATP-dependent DNA helicase PcrA
MQLKTVSKNEIKTGHDGLFIVGRKDVNKYADIYKPQVLRYNKIANTEGLGGINFGLCKGQNYDHVLIFPTEGMRKYLKNRNVEEIGDVPKFYVAITRARYSVAIVFDDKTCFKEFNHIEM